MVIEKAQTTYDTSSDDVRFAIQPGALQVRNS